MGLDEDRIVRLLFVHRNRILSYIWSLVRDFDMAEDIFQDVSVLALQKASLIQDEPHFHRWIRVTSRLTSLSTMRRFRKFPMSLEAPFLDQLDLAWASVEDTATDESAEVLNRCLKHLSTHARRVIDLRYRDGLMGQALADATGRSVNTAYRALTRAHRFLKDCVRQGLGEAPEGAPAE